MAARLSPVPISSTTATVCATFLKRCFPRGGFPSSRVGTALRLQRAVHFGKRGLSAKIGNQQRQIDLARPAWIHRGPVLRSISVRAECTLADHCFLM